MTSPDDILWLDPLTNREREVLQLMAEGLSNQGIATRLFLTLGTVKWYNTQIFSKLGVRTRAEAIARLRRFHLLDNLKPQPRADLRPGLPAMTTVFFGRSAEIESLSALLRGEARIITLVGPPGVGKTRLSLEVAARLADAFPDGVFQIPLATSTSEKDVLDRIMQTVGAPGPSDLPLVQALKHHLHAKAMLLLLDNCEHLVNAAPVLGDLIAAAPGLKLLITSREVLRLYGEYAFTVTPLPTAHDRADFAAIAASPAVQLFVDRARLIRRDFQLTEANAAVIASMSDRLDGLPLAIELAASRLKLFSPEQLLSKLSSRLTILTHDAQDAPTRHQTLKAAIDWSYSLLSAPEKVAFAAWSIFNGGWTLEAAEAVGTAIFTTPQDTITLLSSLLNKSLIQVTDSALVEPRFSMLATLQEFAREKRQQAVWASQVADAHARYFLDWAEQINADFQQSDQTALLDRLELDYDNLKAALDHFAAQADGAPEELRLVGALESFWFIRARHADGRPFCRRALQRDRPEIPGKIRFQA